MIVTSSGHKESFNCITNDFYIYNKYNEFSNYRFCITKRTVPSIKANMP